MKFLREMMSRLSIYILGLRQDDVHGMLGDERVRYNTIRYRVYRQNTLGWWVKTSKRVTHKLTNSKLRVLVSYDDR